MFNRTTNATISNQKNMSQLCRLCAEAKSAHAFVGIYEAEGRQLDVEAKIAKCLRIQVFANDCLPQYVCVECCGQLNQCSDFYERTNQAQLDLRRMLLEPSHKVKEDPQNISEPVLQATVDYIDNTEEVLCKEEGLVDSTVVEHFVEEEDSNEHELVKDEDCQITKEIEDDSKSLCKVVAMKKKTKKKNDQEESEELLCHGIEKEKSDQEDEKTNVRVPDNYMTGTDSDIETIVLGRKNNNVKAERKKPMRMDRYPWLCTDCNDKLPSLEALEEHHKTIHNQKAKYMCVQCCKVYEKYYGFLTHVKRHKNKMKYTCDDCGKSFVHKKVLETHKATHSDQRPHVCRTCGKAFRQQSALYIHSRCHLPENMKNRFPCDQCEKSFSTKPNLVTHKRIHSGVRNFTCDQCGKSFIQKGNLEAHFLTHSTDKPYNCSQCPKAFKTPLQLKKHETVHTGAKPHQCAVCGRTFREKGTLREHHRIHTGAMPFECEFCGKHFRFKGILTTHRRQHTGERPYSCQECQHHFTNWPNYNKHMKRRHGINTSQSKNVQQQQNQETQQKLQEAQPQIQSQIHVQSLQNPAEQMGLSPVHATPSTVQVIQAVPHVTVSTQPIVLQTLPSSASVTTIENFSETNETVSVSSTGVTTSQHHQRGGYFNAISAPLGNFLPSNLPYNFYNIPNVGESDLMHHR